MDIKSRKRPRYIGGDWFDITDPRFINGLNDICCFPGCNIDRNKNSMRHCRSCGGNYCHQHNNKSLKTLIPLMKDHNGASQVGMLNRTEWTCDICHHLFNTSGYIYEIPSLWDVVYSLHGVSAPPVLVAYISRMILQHLGHPFLGYNRGIRFVEEFRKLTSPVVYYI